MGKADDNNCFAVTGFFLFLNHTYIFGMPLFHQIVFCPFLNTDFLPVFFALVFKKEKKKLNLQYDISDSVKKKRKGKEDKKVEKKFLKTT